MTSQHKMATLVGDFNTFAMDSPFLLYGDEGLQEWSPVDLHGACPKAVPCFQSERKMVFQRSTFMSWV